MSVTTIPLAVAGAYAVMPETITDERGSYRLLGDSSVLFGAAVTMSAQLPFSRWVMTRSYRGVIRGLHLRPPPGEAKLVRCTAGRVFDIIADCRASSPTYRVTDAVILDAKSQYALYIPAGVAHGYQALTGPSDVHYRIDAPAAGEDLVIDFADPQLGISWPLPAGVISARDRAGQPFAQVLAQLGSDAW